jgi:hypothetical protein
VYQIAGVTLAASFSLGIAASRGWVHLGRRRWLHHVLFLLAVVATSVAFAVGTARGDTSAWFLAIVLVLLALLPRTRGGGRRHVAVACCIGAVYLVGLLAP